MAVQSTVIFICDFCGGQYPKLEGSSYSENILVYELSSNYVFREGRPRAPKLSGPDKIVACRECIEAPPDPQVIPAVKEHKTLFKKFLTLLNHKIGG